MSREDLMAKLNEIFIDVFEDEDIVLSNEMTAEDVEDWDSLTHLQLISEIEDTFHIHFTMGEIQGFKNVGELCDTALKYINR